MTTKILNGSSLVAAANVNNIGAVALLWCVVPWCAGQAANPVPAQSSSSSRSSSLHVIAHGSFPVRISRTLDSSRLKEDTLIEAETGGSFRLPDGRLVPKGSKITGRVTASMARSRGDTESELGLVFDRIHLTDGGDMKLKAVVQAVYPPLEQADPGTVNGYTMAANPGGVGYLPPDITVGSNPASRARAEVELDTKFVGVQGMGDLELRPSGLVISPQGQRVKLGKGARLVVRAMIFD